MDVPFLCFHFFLPASHPTPPTSFQLYNSGVYYNPKCSSKALNHAVLAAGYGTQGGQEYWLVKNSWGTDWGDDGYIMMARGQGNNCGVATDASFVKI